MPVSVILPTYNRVEFLPEAVKTVLRQSYERIELIVVDDGSSDTTRECVRKLCVEYSSSQKRIVYLYQEHSGVSAARNLGLTKAQEDWIAFLDSDDLWKKTKLYKQMHILLSSDYQACYTQEQWIRNGAHLNQSGHHQQYSGYIYTRTLERCIISPSSFCGHRSIFEVLGGFDESFVACEDYEYWLRLTARYKVYFLNEVLITKRGGHKDQLSRQYEAMDRFRVEALRKILRSGLLTFDEYEATRETLIKKAIILMNGAQKRHNSLMQGYYKKLLQIYTDNVVSKKSLRSTSKHSCGTD